MRPIVVTNAEELRSAVAAAKAKRLSVGFVPTMGALHEGHASLLREARRRDGFVVASIFVNPTQFDNPADLAKYPRTEDGDAALLATVGADAIFAPGLNEVYPDGFATDRKSVV